MPHRRFNGFVLVTLVCALVSCSIALANDVPKERTPDKVSAPLPFVPTEQLVYEGVFSKFLLRGIKIAELKFTVGRPPTAVETKPGSDPKGQPSLFFTSEVVSKGWFRKLFGINFRYHVESTVELGSFNVLRTSKVDEQGKRVRTSEAIFDPESKRVEWTERDANNPQQPPRVVTAALDGPTHDIISAIYFLRTQPLTPGRTFDLAISDSGRVYHVPATVTNEKKKIKTILGKVEVVRLDVGIFGQGRPIEDNGKMMLWVTADERRIPIRAKLSHDMGTVDIKLTSMNSAKGSLR